MMDENMELHIDGGMTQDESGMIDENAASYHNDSAGQDESGSGMDENASHTDDAGQPEAEDDDLDETEDDDDAEDDDDDAEDDSDEVKEDGPADENIELLRDIYSNSEMGKDSLFHLVKNCEDEHFRYIIGVEYGEYNEINNEAERILKERSAEPKCSCLIKKTGINASIRIHMMIDKTSSHLAEMVLQGSVMGVIDMTRSMREFQNVDAEVKGLAQRLLDAEDKNIAAMRSWI